MLFAHMISVMIGMYLDSSSPYVSWSDEYSALRGNLNSFFNMALMMIISLGVVIAGLLIYELLKLPIIAYYIVMLFVLGGVAARLYIVGTKKIVENMSCMS